MRLPKAYRIDLYDDDRGTLWMENVTQEPGPWPPSGSSARRTCSAGCPPAVSRIFVQPLPRGGDFNQPGTRCATTRTAA